MSRTRNSETTADDQAENKPEKFATKVFNWLRQINHHAKRGGTLLPVDVQVSLELSQYFTESDQGGRAFPSRKTLADPLNISERTVDRSIRRMNDHDHLRVVWGKQGSKHPHQYWMVAKPEEEEENGHPDARLQTGKTGISSKETGIFERKTGTHAPENHYNHENHGGHISPPPVSFAGEGRRSEAGVAVGIQSDRAKPDGAAKGKRIVGNTDPGDADGLTADFKRFWSTYPRRIDEAKAWRAFAKLTPQERREALAAVPLFASERQTIIADDPTQDQFTPYPANWLKDKRWRDASSSAGPTIDQKGNIQQQFSRPTRRTRGESSMEETIAEAIAQVGGNW